MRWKMINFELMKTHVGVLRTQFIVALFTVVLVSCKRPPKAQFTISPQPAAVGDSVFVSSTSEDATGFEWDFGNGAKAFTEKAVTSYSTPGNFTVTLVVRNELGFDQTIRILTVFQ
jgi:PKD repeat protein